ncbi:MAG TPA: hypothetical protein VFG20_17395, partial [Planctomycetaceae bacterium]|nr:hypothetical protein [Planctomycetaceae bacterium]
VIYIGDGIVSSGDTDASNFVKRINLLFGAKDNGPRRTFHAIGVGNTTEMIALRGIAVSGGGSVRMIAGEQTPAVVATELLNEIAQPGLRDLQVEFKGVKIAAVDPERLPNLPAGTQQILTARYLPQGTDQHGEIIVTGKRGKDTVRFAAKIDFRDAEAGNSFIPRLWARSHLDHLLNQGSSPMIRDEIIALSEQFHIITPYTSLLVLETDADRERFGVKRRYEMRDGERFFAEGRDAAQFELLQAQMKRAGDWRQGLRRQALLSLRNWGRDADAFHEETAMLNQRRRYNSNMPSSSVSGPRGGSYYDNSGIDGLYEINGAAFGRLAGFGSGGGSLGAEFEFARPEDSLSQLNFFSEDAPEELAKSIKDAEVLGEERLADDTTPFQTWDTEPDSPFDGDRKQLDAAAKPMDARLGILKAERGLFERLEAKDKTSFLGRRGGRLVAGQLAAEPRGYAGFAQASDFAWFNTLFPHLPMPSRPAEVPVPKDWTPEAIAISESLLRTAALKQRAGGLELRRTTDSFDPRWQRKSGQDRDLVLVSPREWLSRTLNPGVDVIVNYCRAQERGVFSSMLQLGRRRAAVDADRTEAPLGLSDHSLTPLHHSYHHYTAKTEPAGDNQTWLILSYPNAQQTERCLIDTARHVLLRREYHVDGKKTFTVTFDDFIEIDGRWWARKVVQTDDRDRVTSQTVFTIETITDEQFQQRLNTELAPLPQVQLVALPFVTLKKARQAIAEGRANFDDHWRMLLHDFSLQQWDDLGQDLAAIEAAAVNKPGLKWLRIMLNAVTRRKEEARQAYLAEARKLVDAPQPFDLPLTTFILNQTYGITAWNEFHELVEMVKPVYSRQPAEHEALVTWDDFYLRCLDALQRKTEALELARQRSTAQPWHLHWQTDYAARLFAAGQTEAAYAWLQQELDRKVERPVHEDETLRTAIVEQYRQQARWTDLVEFTTSWIAREPATQSYHSPYAIHLSALVYAGKLDAAYALGDQWLKDAQHEGPLPLPVQARLNAALNFATGSAYQLSFYRMPARWQEPLAALARYYVKHSDDLSTLQRAVSHHQFSETDVADELRGEWLRMLQADAEHLSPAKLQTLVGWTLNGRMQLEEPIQGRKQLVASEIPDDIWSGIAATVEARWKAAEKPADRHVLGEALRSIYSTRFRAKLLPFLRLRLQTAPQEHVLTYRRALFDELLATTWTTEGETESFALLHQLSDTPHLHQRLEAQLPLLYRWVEAMVGNRQTVAQKTLEDAGELNKLTRQQLAAKKTEFRASALRSVATHLKELLPQESEPLAAWVRLERQWLLGQLGEELTEAEATAWEILGEVPPARALPKDDAEEMSVDPNAPGVAGNDLDAEWKVVFQDLLQRRALTTVMALAARKQAKPESIDRLFKYLDAGIAQGGDAAEVWRKEKLRLLVALDRPDDLDRQLREWIQTDHSTAPWKVLLAHLQAERGQITEAITLFEAVEKDKLLTYGDYRHLADWYLVANRRADSERAKLEAVLQTPEHILSNTVQQSRYRWTRTDIPLPSELDENTLLIYRALFRKSANPENYLYSLREHYTACRDFRLLQMVPEAMLGRTPQQVYNFIQNLSGVLHELRNEATADEIIATIAKLRTPERTPTDLRALDLLEALVERQSSEVLNQPGPHVDAALAALKRAFDRDWQPGEPVAMANFLYQLGGLTQAPLKDEQLRELRVLQQQSADDPRAHLQITTHLANLLGWRYNQNDIALREMEAEIRSYSQRHDGRWPHQDHQNLSDYISLFQGAGQHAAGEAVLAKFREVAEHEEQRRWFDFRLMTLYNHALEHQGTVSLGTGDELFARLMQRVLRDLDAAPNENVRYEWVSQIVNTFN